MKEYQTHDLKMENMWAIEGEVGVDRYGICREKVDQDTNVHRRGQSLLEKNTRL